ncbi:DUF1192 domain-containing protein [Methylocella silvestris]|uniref:DUF1192 domain-containing protein n=1 Tax=Methylocella silvestris TaxID=199596 RepID=A0A2J7TGD4_METSI|nr:DUF1192 domain-containing protein [Methylocella silvestris]PNG25834.1 hypothetical protein CR492_11965 [Methylocella silvestris]
MSADEGDFLGAPARKAPEHEIGQSLDDLSISQIEERIALLFAEIDRLEVARKAKQASLGAAAAFFKT